MIDWIKKYSVSCFIIGILILIIVININNPFEEETIIKTDTLYITKYDTIKEYYPKYIYKKTIDTILIYMKDSSKVEIPIEEKYYKKDNSYELWITGYQPNLRSINVFNKTEYKTITNTITNTIYKYSWRGYANARFSTFDGKVIPSIGFTIISPKSVLLGAEIGVLDNNPVYSISFGYKLFGK